MLGILAAIAIPAYQDYTLRAGVADANHSAAALAERMETYAAAHPAQPLNPAIVGIHKSLGNGRSAADLVVDADGVISVKMLHGRLQGKSLLWVPERRADHWAWHCKSLTIERKNLPRSCRGD